MSPLLCMRKPNKYQFEREGVATNYVQFDHVSDFNRFVDSESLSYANKHSWKNWMLKVSLMLTEEVDWFGQPQPKDVQTLEDHRRFLGMNLLNELRPKIKQHLKKYLDALNDNTLPKPTVDYNERGLGMFSFDRATLGLVKNIPVNLSTPLSTAKSQLAIETNQTVFETKVKKVYAYFKNKAVKLPSIKLYLLAGGNANVNGTEMLYVGLACAELVQFLEARGVPVEVNVIIGNAFDNSINMAIVRIKAFDQNLDVNQLLLMSSDPRYFRYRGFKSLIALANYFNLTIPSGFGRSDPGMAKQFTNHIDFNAYTFEQSYSLEAAAKEVVRIVEAYKKRKTDERKDN